MTVAKIIVPRVKLPPLDYLISTEIKIGQLVIVPFRDEELVGIVIDININSDIKSLKSIIRPFEPQTFISTETLAFMKKAKEYYFTEIGSITKLAIPIDISNPKIKTISQDFNSVSLKDLSAAQTTTMNQIKSSGVTVLHGVTGSGKTEIYFHLIYKYILEGKQALFLLPEIALSKQMIHRFEERFNTKAVIWNASITQAQKCKILKSIITGDIKVIIGARSALFLPYKNLGIIIVDEEHDASYKQEDTIPYNARDMAVLRAHLSNIPVILGSATPSLESFYNVQNNKYHQVTLTSRFGDSTFPNIIPIDMRGIKEKGKWISNKLRDAIAEALAKKEQVMLFLNRKGYSPLLVCDICGYKPECPSCSSSLVVHKISQKLICHHCGFHTKYFTKCTECNAEDSMIPCGPGVERIYEEVTNHFPKAKLQLMTRDEMRIPKNAFDILNNITNGRIDIIIGTQIITKGYHFPQLTTIGIIDADIGLSGGDLRAAENSFHLLYQLAGRAGREELQGNIYIQTFQPNSNFINLLKSHNFEEFMNHELSQRKVANMPPISKMASLILSDKNEARVKRIAAAIARVLPESENVLILGPAPSIMAKVKNQYRYRILLIANNTHNLHNHINNILNSVEQKILRNIRIDIDPYNFS